jgi:hypothetical protein
MIIRPATLVDLLRLIEPFQIEIAYQKECAGRAFWEKQGFSEYRLLMSKAFE